MKLLPIIAEVVFCFTQALTLLRKYRALNYCLYKSKVEDLENAQHVPLVSFYSFTQAQEFISSLRGPVLQFFQFSSYTSFFFYFQSFASYDSKTKIGWWWRLLLQSLFLAMTKTLANLTCCQNHNPAITYLMLKLVLTQNVWQTFQITFLKSVKQDTTKANALEVSFSVINGLMTSAPRKKKSPSNKKEPKRHDLDELHVSKETTLFCTPPFMKSVTMISFMVT